jgi:hypothetical protein
MVVCADYLTVLGGGGGKRAFPYTHNQEVTVLGIYSGRATELQQLDFHGRQNHVWSSAVEGVLDEPY